MLFNLAFFTGLLLVPAALAVPTALGDRIARRREGLQSQFNSHLWRAASAVSDTQYSTNWAGAVWNETEGTFTSVTGTFTVPTPSGTPGSVAAAWVGIDGATCGSAILQTGVAFFVTSKGPEYVAWYEWYPAPATYFFSLSIFAGDVIALNVTSTSSTSGTATVENLTSGQVVSANLTSDAPLCGQNAEWIVEDVTEITGLAPFADFGTVTFTNAEATGAGTYTPSGAIISNIKQNNTVLTSTTVSGSSVTIQYL